MGKPKKPVFVDFIITHGEKGGGPNPHMTERGFIQIRRLLSELRDPEWRAYPPTHVICGVGNRHLDTAGALGLTPRMWDPRVGNADSLEDRAGVKMIRLSGDQLVELKSYHTISSEEACGFIYSLTGGAVICSGREFMRALNGGEGVSAALYRVTHTSQEIIQVSRIAWVE